MEAMMMRRAGNWRVGLVFLRASGFGRVGDMGRGPLGTGAGRMPETRLTISIELAGRELMGARWLSVSMSGWEEVGMLLSGWDEMSGTTPNPSR